MAVSTLKLKPKGHLDMALFTRAAVLRHTHTEVPRGDCISCSHRMSARTPARTAARTPARTAAHTPARSTLPHSSQHQCLFCAGCLKQAANDNKITPKRNIRSSQEILANHFVVQVRIANTGKEGSESAVEPEKAQERRSKILCESLSAFDRKPAECGFCRKAAAGAPVRYCVPCRKYLCVGCYAWHQGQDTANLGTKWMFHRHATVDLTSIRNPDIL